MSLKRRSRIQSGGIVSVRVVRDGLGPRTIFQARELSGNSWPIDPIYFARLSDELHESAKRMQGFARWSYLLKLPRPEYRFAVLEPSTPIHRSLDEVDSKTLRVIITPDTFGPVEVDSELPHVARIEYRRRGHSIAFSIPDFSRTQGNWDVVRFARFLLWDLSMAQSDPNRTAVDRFILAHGHKAFFTKKIEYVQQLGRPGSLGEIAPGATYVSFATLCADANGWIDWPQYIKMWDEFLVTHLRDLLPTASDEVRTLNNLPAHRHQISRRRLLAKLTKGALEPQLTRLGAAVGVVVLPVCRPSAPEHFDRAVQFGFSQNSRRSWHRQIGVLSWEQFVRCPVDMVENAFLQPVKVIFRA